MANNKPMIGLPPPPIAANRTLIDDVAAARIEDDTQAVQAIEYLIGLARDNSLNDVCSRLEICRNEITGRKLPEAVLNLLTRIHCGNYNPHHLLQIANVQLNICYFPALAPSNSTESPSTADAYKYQQLLIVNHIQHCSQWGPAIKRVISCVSSEEAPPPAIISDSLDQNRQAESIPVQYFSPDTAASNVATLPEII